MRRFAQKTNQTLEGIIGYENIEQINYEKQLEAFKKSEVSMFKFCADLKAIGITLKTASAGVSGPYSILAAGLSYLGDKLFEIGNDVKSTIETKREIIFGLSAGAAMTSIYQPTGKKPGAKRFIPFIGDVVNFTYTLTLKPSDFTNDLKTIFASYKCDGKHTKTSAPLMIGIYPNFLHHPELDDQYRAKMESISSLANNLSSLIQNVEAAIALLATILLQPEFAVAVRIAGGIVEGLLNAIGILFSPNTYDLMAYSKEDFKGRGIDPSNPLAFLNKIPGISEYTKLVESKPIAEESKAASEKRVQNFILISIIEEPVQAALIRDTLGNEEWLRKGEKWPKWNITITNILQDHVEYKDSYGDRYSIRGMQPSYSNKNLFDQVMKDASNLSASSVKGDINKLLSKKTSFIISLLYQLKNKYPWIGDSKNPKWINLQSDILSHIIRVPKKRKPTPKPVASTPMMTPVNKSRTPGTTDLDREMKRREDLPSL
jgi:hypothetical protein